MAKKFASRVDVASILGINRRTFSNYCTGRRQVTNIDVRKKLFDITGIENFKSDTPDTQDSVLLTIWADLHIETPSNRKNDDKHDGKDDNVEGLTSKKEDLIVLKTDKNNLGGIDRPFVDVATDLRNWFDNQYLWKTQKEIAEYVGSSHSKMKKIFQGIKKPEGDIKQKMYEITQLECFRDDDQEKSERFEEKNISTGEDSVHIDDANVCVNKIGIPIYEVETSIDRKNGHTKKMHIPIHEVKIQVTEIKEPTGETQKIVTEVNKSIVEANDSISEINGSISEVNDTISEINGSIVEQHAPDSEIQNIVDDVQKLIEETNDLAKKVNEFVAELNEPISKIQEPIEELNGGIEKLKEPIEEPVIEVQENIKEPVQEIKEIVPEPVKESFTEVQGSIKETAPASVTEAQESIEEPVQGVKETVSEHIKEPISEVKETASEPVTEVQKSIKEVQEYIGEHIKEPISEVKETVSEHIKEPISEVKSVGELKLGKLGKNYHVDSLRNLADYIEGLEQEIKLLRSNRKNGNKKSSTDEVEKLANAFYSLAKVLKQFKNCTPEQRKKVKSMIHAQDFGYVTSFMKAMYDEQSFADFMFFADYELKGDIK
jgi:methyl-accepting chemotaxis protein